MTLTYHLLVKFSIVGGIGVLKNDQQESRDIYDAANRPSNIHRVNIVKALETTFEILVLRAIMIVNLGTGHQLANKEPSA